MASWSSSFLWIVPEVLVEVAPESRRLSSVLVVLPEAVVPDPQINGTTSPY